MKTTLTPKQSATLIARGISAESASMCMLDFDYDGEIIDSGYVWEENGKLLAIVNDEAIDVERKIISKESDFDHSYENDTPIFTLPDLCSLLPKEIEHGNYNLEILADHTGWIILYSSCHEGSTPINVSAEKEFIDALFNGLIWAIDHNHVKLD